MIAELWGYGRGCCWVLTKLWRIINANMCKGWKSAVFRSKLQTTLSLCSLCPSPLSPPDCPPPPIPRLSLDDPSPSPVPSLFTPTSIPLRSTPPPVSRPYKPEHSNILYRNDRRRSQGSLTPILSNRLSNSGA